MGGGTSIEQFNFYYPNIEIDAVEIDPVIADFGVRYHPARPYSDTRVNVIIDDGRSFITNTRSKYDLIIFALTDSLIKTSPMAQLRLENYLFTKESAKRAFSLLNNHGDLYFYNYYRTPWLVRKIADLIHEATGTAPQVVGQRDNFVIFKAHFMDKTPPAVESDDIAVKSEIPTDDWPFLYLEKRGLPSIYLTDLVCFTFFVVFLIKFLLFSACTV